MVPTLGVLWSTGDPQRHSWRSWRANRANRGSISVCRGTPEVPKITAENGLTSTTHRSSPESSSLAFVRDGESLRWAGGSKGLGLGERGRARRGRYDHARERQATGIPIPTARRGEGMNPAGWHRSAGREPCSLGPRESEMSRLLRATDACTYQGARREILGLVEQMLTACRPKARREHVVACGLGDYRRQFRRRRLRGSRVVC